MKTNELAAAIAAAIDRERKFQSRISFIKSCLTSFFLTIAFYAHNHSPTISVLFLVATWVLSTIHITPRDVDNLLVQVRKTKDQL